MTGPDIFYTRPGQQDGKYSARTRMHLAVSEAEPAIRSWIVQRGVAYVCNQHVYMLYGWSGLV